MAKNISLLGADYTDVPAVQLPQTGGGTATFYDINVIDNLTSDSSTDALSAKQGKTLNSKITKLNGGTAYVGSQNPDTYTETGAFHVGLTATASPTGATIYGMLIVIEHSGTIAQIFIRNSGGVWIRNKASNNDAWTSWAQFGLT